MGIKGERQAKKLGVGVHIEGRQGSRAQVKTGARGIQKNKIAQKTPPTTGGWQDKTQEEGRKEKE